MVKIIPVNTNNLKKPQIKTKPTSINDSEFMDVNGNPYPQILTLDNIRDIYDDELAESYKEDARRGFRRRDKQYYEVKVMLIKVLLFHVTNDGNML